MGGLPKCNASWGVSDEGWGVDADSNTLHISANLSCRCLIVNSPFTNLRYFLGPRARFGFAETMLHK